MSSKVSLDMARWNKIADLPVAVGLGNLCRGLCTVGRIEYAVTGRVSDKAEYMSPSVRKYITVLNDLVPRGVRSRLGSLAIAQRALDCDPKKESARALICADYAVRIFAPMALHATGFHEEAMTLFVLPKITSDVDYKATLDRIKVVVCTAADREFSIEKANCFGALQNAGFCYTYLQFASGDAAKSSANYAAKCAAYAARLAEGPSRLPSAWDAAFALLDALLDA